MPLGNTWAREERRRQVEARGGRCEGTRDGARCSRRHRLQFAHLAPTGLAGRGRGLIRRMLDVRKHPDKYALLCHWCHLRLDCPGAFESPAPDPAEGAA